MVHNGHLRLLSPIEVGPLRLSHRVVMAPLTRLRSTVPGDVPSPLMLDYYTQRASEGGLILSEATAISVTGRGYLGAPGIYSEDEVTGWKKITHSVHSNGGHIFLQLWHVGRTSHLEMTGGVPPVGPSVVSYQGRAFTSQGWTPVSPHRALDVSENGLPPVASAQMRQFFKGPIIAAGGFDADSAEAIISKGDADLVAFGRHFIANPDLPQRIRLQAPLNPYDRATFYGGDHRGYTDYPVLVND